MKRTGLMGGLAGVGRRLFTCCHVLADASSCPPGWSAFDESCYVIVQKYLDWFESKVHDFTLF